MSFNEYAVSRCGFESDRHRSVYKCDKVGPSIADI
jgi:hypothetical protein